MRKVEDWLIPWGQFRLPSRRQWYPPGWEGTGTGVEVGEVEIERPKKNRNRSSSGQQQGHLLKAQVLMEFETGQGGYTVVNPGRTHDFKRLKQSRLPFVASQ